MEDMEKSHWALLFLSGAFIVLVGLDLFTDFSSGGSMQHMWIEGLLLLLSGGVFVNGMRHLTAARKEIRTLQVDMEKLQSEKDRWHRETRQLMEGLSAKIEKQFAQWNLTPAETEVGFLLLKGLSLKEIADIRETRLKTVQQQSQAIYQKTGLASRAELAAFFLEDLLPSKDPESLIS